MDNAASDTQTTSNIDVAPYRRARSWLAWRQAKCLFEFSPWTQQDLGHEQLVQQVGLAQLDPHRLTLAQPQAAQHGRAQGLWPVGLRPQAQTLVIKGLV